MSRPVIGISTYRETARWGVWNRAADLLPMEYAAALSVAGAAPILLPIQDASAAQDLMPRLDALVVAGGSDIEPARYGAEAHPKTTGWRPARDAWECALLDAAAARDLPTLGICRGLQVMTVWAGGTLIQHVPDAVGHRGHSPGGETYGTMAVAVAGGTLLQRLVGDAVDVSCHHHQAVATLGRGVVAAQASDGLVEAVEDPGRRFWLGVQWHPETLDDQGLFRGLVAATR